MHLKLLVLLAWISHCGVARPASVSALAPPAPRAESRILGTGPDAVPTLIDALRNEAKVL